MKAALNRISLITGVLDAHLGVRLDVGGEKLFLVDSHGQSVPELVASVAMARLALRAHPGGTLVVPVHLPGVFEQIAAEQGGQVLRCRVDSHDLMEMASREGVIMATDGAGNFIFPQFQAVIDGLMATAKLLEFLATQHTSLAEVVAGLPAFYVSHREIPCPWEAKGTVMRLLNQKFKEHRTELVDGIKILSSDREWALVLPDPDYPRLHIYAEAHSDGEACHLADHYAQVVQDLQK